MRKQRGRFGHHVQQRHARAHAASDHSCQAHRGINVTFSTAANQHPLYCRAFAPHDQDCRLNLFYDLVGFG